GDRSARRRAERAQRGGAGHARGGPAAHRARAAARGGHGHVSRHTVLVVDDEASIADGLRLTLESEGMSVRLAGSVRTALAAVAQTDVQAAIVDLMLPDGDGLTLTRELKARDAAMEVIASVADADANVLILGESGTGKELIANALHERSGRRDGPFVKINCAALPKDLIESELFGHTKGSFTGATMEKVGLLEEAHK